MAENESMNNCGMTCQKCGKFEEGNSLHGHVCKKPIYYGPPDEERYYHECFEDYVHDFIGDYMPDEEVPETVTVVGMSPVDIPEAWIKNEAEFVVERVIESFDEDYGDFENPTLEDPVKLAIINKAAIEFVKMFSETYPVWQCEEVSRETVKISDYLDKN